MKSAIRKENGAGEGGQEAQAGCGIHRAGRVRFPEKVRLEQRLEADRGDENGLLVGVQRPWGQEVASGVQEQQGSQCICGGEGTVSRVGGPEVRRTWPGGSQRPL